MKKFLLVVAIAAATTVGFLQSGVLPQYEAVAPASNSDQAFADALENHSSGLQIEGHGIVTRILSDDLDGSRHQRFIVELGSGQSLLVVHNIDLAPRVAALKEGDEVTFYGEYEWTSQGGLIHWTHHDPDASHADGWIEHDGETYQ
ncbi:MAG: DUF3465 domain-containing protein [Gammaproteobacteria bacterium]|nr:DUF3465 domain-containing protein [Gammaproteobacteria bacterium]MBA3732125.1 DUF3465 domain-containing protein [Gammaproteobacteria bacterium]